MKKRLLLTGLLSCILLIGFVIGFKLFTQEPQPILRFAMSHYMEAISFELYEDGLLKVFRGERRFLLDMRKRNIMMRNTIVHSIFLNEEDFQNIINLAERLNNALDELDYTTIYHHGIDGGMLFAFRYDNRIFETHSGIMVSNPESIMRQVEIGGGMIYSGDFKELYIFAEIIYTITQLSPVHFSIMDTPLNFITNHWLQVLPEN